MEKSKGIFFKINQLTKFEEYNCYSYDEKSDQTFIYLGCKNDNYHENDIKNKIHIFLIKNYEGKIICIDEIKKELNYQDEEVKKLIDKFNIKLEDNNLKECVIFYKLEYKNTPNTNYLYQLTTKCKLQNILNR